MGNPRCEARQCRGEARPGVRPEGGGFGEGRSMWPWVAEPMEGGENYFSFFFWGGTICPTHFDVRGRVLSHVDPGA